MNWVIRFVIAFSGATITAGWSVRWLEGRTFPSLQTGPQYWLEFVVPIVAPTFVSLAFLFWAMKLLIELRIVGFATDARRQVIRGIVYRRLAIWGAAGLAAIALPGYILSGTAMMRVGGWISVLGFTAVTLWTVRDHPSNSLEYGATSGHSFPKEPRRRSSLFSSSMGWLIGILIVIAPISIQMKLISAGVLLLLTLIPPFAGQWTLHAAQEGDFDRALQRAKLTSWLPGFPKIVIGTVLLDAGRYPEAHDFLKPLAIDAMGRPRVECSELYLYALSLSNAGEEEAAQQLLEAAAQAAPPSGPVKFPIGAVQVALACCLLSQNKEPERAERIIEQALLVDQSASTKACRLAVHAWAEASCGHANEAKAELERAFECVPEGDRRTQAAVLYAAGDMWLALGELSKARTAFESVQSLRNGDLAIRARRKLSQLENVR